MVQQISKNAIALANQTITKNNIILVIKGIPFIFGSLAIKAKWNIGDEGVFIGATGLTIGGEITLPNSRPYISLSGTTNSISSQIEIDKGGGQSIQKMIIAMVDKNDELTSIFKPGKYVTDLLGSECEIFLMFDGGLYPTDAMRVFSGTIDSHSQGAGQWKLSISHPDKLKDTEIFEQVTAKLAVAISDTDTTFTLDSTSNFIIPGDSVKTYVRIGDEIARYTGISGSDLTGITRGEFNTIALAADVEDELTSQYYLEGNAIDLALKVMLSNENNGPFEIDIPATKFNQVAPTEYRSNSFLVSSQTFQNDNNLRVGDLVTITGALNAANNVTNKAIFNFELISDGTVITLSDVTFVDEIGSSALSSYKSQYNVLPNGCGVGMNPRQCDIDQHELIFDTYGAAFPSYSIPIKDTIKAAELLTSEVYYPTGLINVPRGGRSSVVYTTPPLVLASLVRLTEKNIENPDKLEIKRSINKNFYNSTVYRFNEDAVEEKFLAGEIIISNKSAARIKTGNKSLRIDSKGFQDTPGTRSFIANQARKYNDRFQFAAESIEVEPLFGGAPGESPTFNLDVGDTVLFGSSDLKVNDLEKGTRSFTPRLFEIVNKSINLKNGNVSLSLLDTKQGSLNDGRFGSISPSSFTASGSSISSIKIKPSFGVTLISNEREKYRDFIGDKIRIRNSDFTYIEETTIVQFDPGDSSRLTILPIALAPGEDFIVELPDYPLGSDATELSTMKEIHCFLCPQVEIVSGISNTSFTVSALDIVKFFVGSPIRVHSDDFTIDTTEEISDDDPQVTAIDTGTNTITCDDLGFTPIAGYKVDLIGFPDSGAPYRLV